MAETPEYSLAEPEHLMELYQRGDGKALDELQLRYQHIIYQYQLALSRDRDLARDLTQDTFLALMRSKDKYKSDKPLAPWLMAIARNVGFGWLRKLYGARRIATSLKERREMLMSLKASGREQSLTVKCALPKLPVDLRELCELLLNEELTNGEIAEVLHCSERTVNLRKQKLVLWFRQLLAPVLPASKRAPLPGAIPSTGTEDLNH
jgi:RNA polymerase sigma-70 factor (ECF subfamily)